MHLVQTKEVVAFPFIIIRIFCRLGKKSLFALLTIFEPVPPLLLTKPLRTTLLPFSGPLPHITHVLNMIKLLIYRDTS